MSGRQLQLALDLKDTASALSIAQRTAPVIDIIEAGTVLCLARGLEAVRMLRAAFPESPLLSDIRIARAGAKFATMCFEAGASRVSVVAESGRDVILSACDAAKKFDAAVEAELFDGWTDDNAKSYIDAGIDTLIVHRTKATAEENDDIKAQLDRLDHLTEGTNTKVTLAGGLTMESLPIFSNCHFDIAVCGSAITSAKDPLVAAMQIRTHFIEIN